MDTVLKCMGSCFKDIKIPHILKYKGNVDDVQRIKYTAFWNEKHDNYHTLDSFIECNIIIVLLHFIIVNWDILKNFHLDLNEIEHINKEDFIDFPALMKNVAVALISSNKDNTKTSVTE